MDRPSNRFIAPPDDPEPPNGAASISETLEQLHRDLELNYQTTRALIDVLCDLREDLKIIKPLARDARLLFSELSAEMRAARFDRGGEFAELETKDIPRTPAELQALRDRRAAAKPNDDGGSR